MELSRRELIAQKLRDKEPLTLDERVYYHELKILPPFAVNVEPMWQTAQDVKDFFQARGRPTTDESISAWLDGMNVPK